TENLVENDNEKTERLAAVAYAYAKAGTTPVSSLKYFDELYGRVTPTERAMIVARVEEVVAGAPMDQLREAFDHLPDRMAPSTAVAAIKTAADEEQKGNAAEAKRLREVAAPARAAVGLPKIAIGVVIAPSAGTPGFVGAIVPLGGKSNRIA